MISLPDPIPDSFTLECFGPELIELSHTLKARNAARVLGQPFAIIQSLKIGKSPAHYIVSISSFIPIAKQPSLL